MKQKLFMGVAAIFVILAGIILNQIDSEVDTSRYHQHLEQPSAEELLPCDFKDSGICTHLPIILIETGGQKIPGAAYTVATKDGDTATMYEKGNYGEEEILAKVSTVEKIGRWHHESDKPDLHSLAYIRYRGDSSRYFDKRGYRIKLVNEKNVGKDNDLPLLGMSSESDWALHGPFLDKTLIRNYMWMNISAEIMGYAPNVRFCELIVDGKYQGLYVLMETIKVAKSRVSLTHYKKGDPVTSYIVEITGLPDPERTINNFTKYTKRMENPRTIEVIYPTRDTSTPEIIKYVETDFNEIERILYSSKMYDGSELWSEKIDLNSAADYYILQEFLMINDVFSKSTFFHKDVRGKLHLGPVWDYNNALNNFFFPLDEGEFIVARNGWFETLLTSKDFVNTVLRRYHELRKGVLSNEYLRNYINETVAWLGPAVDRNFEVWGYSFDIDNLSRNEMRVSSDYNEIFANASFEEYSSLYERMLEEAVQLNPKSHHEAVTWMKNTIIYRGSWLDRNMHILLQYCADSKKHSKMVD